MAQPKIKLKEIKIHWAEGDNSKYDIFPQFYKTWEAAHKAIIPIFNDFIKSGARGYNKVKFTAYFEDGDSYEGRLDVSDKEDNPTSTTNVIGNHINDFLMYQMSEKSQTSEAVKKEAKDYLDTYDLGLKEFESKIITINDYGFINKALASEFKDKLVTYYYSSEFGMGINKIEGKLLDIGFEKYAQYDNAFFISLIPKGKKKGLKFRQTYNPYAIVIAGVGHPNPDKTMELVKEDKDAKVSKSKHLSFSENWVLEFNTKINKYLTLDAIKIIADVRENKLENKDEVEWKIGGLGQKYIDYKLGTIILKDDGSFLVKYGVNESPTSAKTLEDAKGQLDEYSTKKEKITANVSKEVENDYNSREATLDKQLRTDNRNIINAAVNDLEALISEHPQLYPKFIKKMHSIPKKYRVGVNPYEKDFGIPSVVEWLKANKINIFELLDVKEYSLPKYKPFDTTSEDKTFMSIHSEFSSEDTLRPKFMGSHFDEKGVVTTNAHILLFTEYRGVPSDKKGNYCFTKKCFSNEDQVKSESFPNFVDVIPKDNPYKVVLNVKYLHDFIKNALDFELVDRVTYMLAFEYPERAVDQEIEYIGFNAKFLLDCIEAMVKLGYKELEIAFSSPNKAALIYPSGKYSQIANLKTDFALVMPVLLTGSGFNTIEMDNLLTYNFETNCSVIASNGKEFCFDSNINVSLKEPKKVESIESNKTEVDLDINSPEAQQMLLEAIANINEVLPDLKGEDKNQALEALAECKALLISKKKMK